MKKNILQTIADSLEAAGVPVLGIDVYPEKNEIAVSMRIRPAVNSGGDKEKAAPVVENACQSCADPDCDICPINQNNGDPIKLYTPEEAIKAMEAGKKLKNNKGDEFWYGRYIEVNKQTGARTDHGGGFWYGVPGKKEYFPVQCFSGLYSEETHPQTDHVTRYPACPPEEAIKIMLAGEGVKTRDGSLVYWVNDKDRLGFYFDDARTGESLPCMDFSNLYTAEG